MQQLLRRSINLISPVCGRTFIGKNAAYLFDKMSGREPEVPYESDIVVVGGGLVGMMVAYHIKQLNPLAYGVTLIEKDPTLKDTATSVFYEGLRQQYWHEEHLAMARYCGDFLRKVPQHLAIPDLQVPGISFTPQSTLLLACDEQSAHNMLHTSKLQKQSGVDVEVIGAEELSQLFPWMCTNNITLSSLGYRGEGCYDVGMLMSALKGKNASLGVRFINGEVVGFGKESQKAFSKLSQKVEKKQTMKEVSVKLTSTQHIHSLKFSRCILAAGASSAEVAALAGIGVEEATYTPLPITPRLKHTYLLECKEGPGAEMPMIHHDEFFLRKHHNHYICTALQPLDDKDDDSLSLFQNRIQHQLTSLIPAFNSMKLLKHWQGQIAHNHFDGDLLLGNHPYYLNLFLATGPPCTELSAAVGRVVMEMVLKEQVQLIDPSRFSFDRVMYDEKQTSKAT